jgi:8-oxo-dGTP diphosphatase
MNILGATPGQFGEIIYTCSHHCFLNKKTTGTMTLQKDNMNQSFESIQQLPMESNSYNAEQKILITVDCIILGYDGEQLKVLLTQKELSAGTTTWAVMGGFIEPQETSEDAASRLLYQVTTKTNAHMEQLHTFSAVDRDPAARVISIVYFALTNVTDYKEQLPLAHEAKWFSLNELPLMILDHRDMILKAHARLREKVITHALGFALLPKKFTISQLKSLCEAIYGSPLDRRNFIKKILSLGILKKLNEKEKASSRKGAFYYVLNTTKSSKY